jgi:hypothetical protein
VLPVYRKISRNRNIRNAWFVRNVVFVHDVHQSNVLLWTFC